MRKVMVIAVREFQSAVKTKAFIISLLAMPIFYGGMIAVQVFMKDRVDTNDKRVAVVDQTPGQVVYPAIAEAARKRNETTIFSGDGDERRQIRPRYVLERVEGEDANGLLLELSDRVRAEELFAFVVIGPDVVNPGDDPSLAEVAYHSNSPTYDDIQKWLFGPVNHHVRSLRLQAANVDPALVDDALVPTTVGNLGLVSRDADGNIQPAEETNELANFIVPMGMMMLMFMVIMVGASPLMQSVLEEKMHRIAEVLLGSVTPFELMLGKLLGMVGVSVTISTFYLVGAYFALNESGYGSMFPRHVVWWFVLYQALAVLMFGSVFIAVGAAVTDLKEAQSLMTPVMLVVCVPLFVWINVLKEPTSTFSLIASLIPPATPMLMIIRQTVPPGIPIWQPILGVLLIVATTLVLVFAAGRIFRVGLLMQGRGAKLGEMIGWVARG